MLSVVKGLASTFLDFKRDFPPFPNSSLLGLSKWIYFYKELGWFRTRLVYCHLK
jgi:hypothetical protein